MSDVSDLTYDNIQPVTPVGNSPQEQNQIGGFFGFLDQGLDFATGAAARVLEFQAIQDRIRDAGERQVTGPVIDDGVGTTGRPIDQGNGETILPVNTEDQSGRVALYVLGGLGALFVGSQILRGGS